MLAGGVLAIARSVHYQRTVRVGSLWEALARIGLNQLREIVVQAAMDLRVFRSSRYRACMESLRDHCRATAHLCRLVSRYTPMDEEQSFLAGLLHDVGIAGILLVLGDVERGQQARDLGALWPSIHDAHCRAGACMVQRWDPGAGTAMAVGHHHRVSIDGHPHPMAAVVCVAESLAAAVGTGFVWASTRPTPG